MPPEMGRYRLANSMRCNIVDVERAYVWYESRTLDMPMICQFDHPVFFLLSAPPERLKCDRPMSVLPARRYTVHNIYSAVIIESRGLRDQLRRCRGALRLLTPGHRMLATREDAGSEMSCIRSATHPAPCATFYAEHNWRVSAIAA